MSFFGALLGGAMSGVGAGMASMGADEDRLNEKRLLAQERHQQNLEMQRQRAEDRMALTEQTQALKGGGSRGGKGGDGINLAEMMMGAKTPEEQQQVVRLARTFGGDDVAGLLSDQMYGAPKQATTGPTAGDFARYDRAGEMDAPPPTSTVERAAYDADRGRQALQRLYALALDPAKTDDFAKAERQFGLNDFGAAVAGKAMQKGGSLEDAAAGFSKYSAPKDETGREELAQQRIDATRDRTATSATNSAALRASQEARALDRQITAEAKLLNDASSRDKPAIAARIKQLEARRDAMDSGAPSLTPKAAPAPVQLASPASRAAAWKSKLGATE